MKSKNILGVILVVLSLFLCACTSSLDKEGSVTNVQMLTDTDGFMNINYTSTQEGLYELERQGENNYVNILYTDYETATQQYLCADPACTHNTDSCTSYIANAGELTGLFCWDNHLYIYNKPKDAFPSLIQADMNGANHTPFITFTAQTAPKDAIIGGEGCWYYLNDQILEDTSRLTSLLRFDLSTKTCQTLMEFPATSDGNYFLIGAFQGKLIIKRNSLSGDEKTEIYAYDLAQNKLSTLLTNPNNIICRVIENTLIYWKEGAAEIRGLDLTNNTDKPLYTASILGEGTSLQVAGVSSEYLFVLARREIPMSQVDWDTLSPEVIQGLESYLNENRAELEETLGHTIENIPIQEVYREMDEFSLKSGGYGMNLNDQKFLAISPQSEAQELTLYGGTENSMPVTVLGENSSEFYVYFDYEYVPIVVYDAEGVPYDSEVLRKKTAMISKEDYFAGNPNYREIVRR